MSGQEMQTGIHEGLEHRENIVRAEAGAAPRVMGVVSDAGAGAASEAVHKLAHMDAKDAVLIPILKALAEVSATFAPLQSAAGGLLKVVPVVEVRHCVSI